jgi:hypothetical protein
VSADADDGVVSLAVAASVAVWKVTCCACCLPLLHGDERPECIVVETGFVTDPAYIVHNQMDPVSAVRGGRPGAGIVCAAVGACQGPQPAAAGSARNLRLLHGGRAGMGNGPTTPMERAIPWIIAVCGIVLFGVGAGLASTDCSAAATSAWGFAFLLMVMLLLSKFRRFKGFGFEAELWEQKQADAAALVDQMKSLSKLLSRQMASVAARLALMGFSFLAGRSGWIPGRYAAAFESR